MLERKYRVIFESEEYGGYIARVPALNDLTTEGDTLEEVEFKVQEAITGYIEALLKRNWPIPEEQENSKPFVKNIAGMD